MVAVVGVAAPAPARPAVDRRHLAAALHPRVADQRRPVAGSCINMCCGVNQRAGCLMLPSIPACRSLIATSHPSRVPSPHPPPLITSGHHRHHHRLHASAASLTLASPRHRRFHLHPSSCSAPSLHSRVNNMHYMNKVVSSFSAILDRLLRAAAAAPAAAQQHAAPALAHRSFTSHLIHRSFVHKSYPLQTPLEVRHLFFVGTCTPTNT